MQSKYFFKFFKFLSTNDFFIPIIHKQLGLT